MRNWAKLDKELSLKWKSHNINFLFIQLLYKINHICNRAYIRENSRIYFISSIKNKNSYRDISATYLMILGGILIIFGGIFAPLISMMAGGGALFWAQADGGPFCCKWNEWNIARAPTVRVKDIWSKAVKKHSGFVKCRKRSVQHITRHTAPQPFYPRITGGSLRWQKKCNTPQKWSEMHVLFLLLPFSTWRGLLNLSRTEKPALMPFETVDKHSQDTKYAPLKTEWAAFSMSAVCLIGLKGSYCWEKHASYNK